MSRRSLEDLDARTDRVSREDINENGSEDRPKRIPVSGARDILSATNIPKGHVPRWVNDYPPGRIQKYLDGGWNFLTRAGVQTGDRTVNTGDSMSSLQTRNVGNNTVAYLMVIKEEFFKEDDKAKQDAITNREKAIFDRAKREIDGYGSLNQSTGLHKS